MAKCGVSARPFFLRLLGLATIPDGQPAIASPDKHREHVRVKGSRIFASLGGSLRNLFFAAARARRVAGWGGNCARGSDKESPVLNNGHFLDGSPRHGL
jgi:hypothetical protein